MDPHNEYAYANIGAVMLKKVDYEKCIEYSTKALTIVDYFMNDTKSFSRDNRLEVKLLLRRGKSYEMLSELEKAKEDLDKCITLDPRDPQARQILKGV